MGSVTYGGVTHPAIDSVRCRQIEAGCRCVDTGTEYTHIHRSSREEATAQIDNEIEIEFAS